MFCAANSAFKAEKVRSKLLSSSDGAQHRQSGQKLRTVSPFLRLKIKTPQKIEGRYMASMKKIRSWSGKVVLLAM